MGVFLKKNFSNCLDNINSNKSTSKLIIKDENNISLNNNVKSDFKKCIKNEKISISKTSKNKNDSASLTTMITKKVKIDLRSLKG